MRRRRRFGDALAIPAGELFPDALDDLPAARLAFKRLGRDLAELAQPRASALAADARRGFYDALHRQIVRQFARAAWRTAARCILRSRDRRLRFLGSLALLQIFDCQFELLDQQPPALRRLSESLAPRLGQLQFQPLDLKLADGQFALRRRQHFALRDDHRVRFR